MVRVVVSGAAGRMGRRLLELVQQDAKTTVVGALESASHADLGQTVAALCGDAAARKGAEVRLLSDPPAALQADVVIDFSVPEQTVRMADLCAARGWAIVVGTTGLAEAQQQHLQQVASRTALLAAPNYSVGMNVVFRI